MSMAAPSRVSTPNTTRSSGMNNSVTTVTSTPAPETISPRRSGRCPSGRQKPDSRMNTQQMLCCHRCPCQPVYHAADMPNKKIRSQQA